MKKRVLQLSLTTVIITLLMSCNKKELTVQQEEKIGNEVSNSTEYAAGKFKKEIVVTDESGKNKAFYAIYSDDEDLLSEFLRVNELSLVINGYDIEKLKSDNFTNQKKSDSSDEKFNLGEAPNSSKRSIIIELVRENIQDDVNSYSLKVNNNQQKSANAVVFNEYTYATEYVTYNNFIGIVHRGKGDPLNVSFFRKSHSAWTRFWRGWEHVDGKDITLYATGPYYAFYDWSAHRRKALVSATIPGRFLASHEYVNTRPGFRGRRCKIGTYDYNNYGECFVGSTPEGTVAFIWGPPSLNYEKLNFYHGPVQGGGKKCPMPGTYFDGANCFVMNIPQECVPYVWGRNMLVKSELIP